MLAPLGLRLKPFSQKTIFEKKLITAKEIFINAQS
jgi:hypothetical protein